MRLERGFIALVFSHMDGKQERASLRDIPRIQQLEVCAIEWRCPAGMRGRKWSSGEQGTGGWGPQGAPYPKCIGQASVPRDVSGSTGLGKRQENAKKLNGPERLQNRTACSDGHMWASYKRK